MKSTKPSLESETSTFYWKFSYLMSFRTMKCLNCLFFCKNGWFLGFLWSITKCSLHEFIKTRIIGSFFKIFKLSTLHYIKILNHPFLSKNWLISGFRNIVFIVWSLPNPIAIRIVFHSESLFMFCFFTVNSKNSQGFLCQKMNIQTFKILKISHFCKRKSWFSISLLWNSLDMKILDRKSMILIPTRV